MKSSKPGFIIVIPTYFSSQVSSLDCRYVCSQCHLTHVYTPLILSGPSQELLWDSVFLFNTYYVCSDHPTSYHLQSLCTGISDSRLFPLQYFLASTVDDGILCAWLFPPEDFKSLEGQDGIFYITWPLFIVLVVSYMLKDRIKDLLRYYFAHKLGNKYYDKKAVVTIGKNRVGEIKEGNNRNKINCFY